MHRGGENLARGLNFPTLRVNSHPKDGPIIRFEAGIVGCLWWEEEEDELGNAGIAPSSGPFLFPPAKFGWVRRRPIH